MTNIRSVERVSKFRKRLTEERKRAKLTQEGLAAKLNDLGYGKGQSAISEWETKERLPDIETVFALSQIFGCDCGYLLGDYDERTHDSTDICKATGLSEETVNTLCNLRSWGAETELTAVFDALMYDFKFATKGEDIAPLVYLIGWFLRYSDDSNITARVFIDGEIKSSADATGHSANTLRLNSRIIENAALTEIEQGLISLKRRILRKERGKNGKH